MPARLLEGKPVAAALGERLQPLVERLGAIGVRPCVAVVRLGDDAGSISYARSLERSFERAGFAFRALELPADCGTEQAVAAVAALNDDPQVHGIMLQEPLPDGLDAEALRSGVAAAKDVDGAHAQNAGWLYQNRDLALAPATALGGLVLLDHYGVALEGARVVVIGRSLLVGRPLAMLAMHRHATVTICHSRTLDLPAVAREADILAVAIGRAHYVTPDFVRPGAVVLDFGVNFVDGAMAGDVAPAVAATAAGLTPTPGGTGAVTTAVLRANVVLAAARQAGLEVVSSRLWQRG